MGRKPIYAGTNRGNFGSFENRAVANRTDKTARPCGMNAANHQQEETMNFDAFPRYTEYDPLVPVVRVAVNPELQQPDREEPVAVHPQDPVRTDVDPLGGRIRWREDPRQEEGRCESQENSAASTRGASLRTAPRSQGGSNWHGRQAPVAGSWAANRRKGDAKANSSTGPGPASKTPRGAPEGPLSCRSGSPAYRNGSARFRRASSFGSLGLSGVPGWMHRAGHFSAAFTSWA